MSVGADLAETALDPTEIAVDPAVDELRRQVQTMHDAALCEANNLNDPAKAHDAWTEVATLKRVLALFDEDDAEEDECPIPYPELGHRES